MRYRLAALVMLAGIALAEAGPSIPSSELPGRERERFQPSPLDPFLQPGTPRQTAPLWRWDCNPGQQTRGKRKGKKPKGC